MLLIAGCAIKPRGEITVSSLKSEIFINFSGDNYKFKKKALIAVKSPDKIRFEIKGFWNEPFFIFVYNNRNTKIYFVGENACYDGEIFEKDFNPVELFFGINLENTGIKVNYSNYEIISGINLPLKIEGVFNNNKIQFKYINPLLNIDISDKMFEFVAPASAKIISKEDMVNIIKKWSR
ncbi:MAG: hypothetical protein ABH873_07990 [Candidatus Firestonebacteria bacterium]